RSEHDAALASELVALFRARDADAWERALIAAGVGCVRADADTPGSFWLRDPHARANGLAVETVHPRYGPYVRHGPIVHLGRTPPRCGPGTLAGQHTDAVLASAGYDAAAIADLRARGVVWAEEA
ncbi:MAG: CoA transferase, partial [Chloroflexi bacterium]|nr:CoA transferase [Chloroflexota bacterium]